MLFLVDNVNVSKGNAMNESVFLQSTLSWADNSNSSNLSSQPADMTTVVIKPEQAVSADTLYKVTYVFGMVLIPTFAIFGVVGNILSLVVLVQHRMRSTTNICLAALTVSDLFLLLHSLAFSGIRVYSLWDRAGAAKARMTTYPVLGAYGSIVCARITTWMTTILGVERCIAVYLPMKAKAINSRFNTFLAIAAIYLITALAFLPTALQYKVDHITGPDNQTVSKLKLSILGHNQAFMVPYSLVLNVIFRFVPLVMLIVVNALIMAAIRRTWALRRDMSWGDRNHSSGHEQKRITKMLLAVSAVFLICTLPGAINSIASRINADYSRLGAQGNLYLTLSIVTYFLETVNSSVNFIIYMAYSRKFCHTYQEIFCCRWWPWQPWPMSLRTVRFTPRGPTSTSLSLSHNMQCQQYHPVHHPLVPNSASFHRKTFLSNGLARSSKDMEEFKLFNSCAANRLAATGTVPIHGNCRTCHNKMHSRSHSRSRSRSESQSHSSQSAAQQYS